MNSHNKYLTGLAPDAIENAPLAKMAHEYDLLDAQSEKTINASMQRSAQAMLWALAEAETLSELQDLVMIAEDELRKQRQDSKQDPKTERHSHNLNILGLIDEIETLLHGPVRVNQARLMYCFRKLKIQLSRLNPSAPVITKFLDENLDAITSRLNSRAYKRLSLARKAYHYDRNKMAKANMRLVFKIAAKYRHLGLCYEDLVQEGNLGLIKAIEYFDATKGYRFSTYAFRIISQYIHASVEKQGEIVRKPFLMLREKQRIDQALSRLEQKLGRAISSREVAEQKGLRGEFASDILGRKSAVSADNWEQTNQQVHEADLSDQASSSKVTGSVNTEFVSSVLESLPERERNMVIMRYGIGVRRDYTLDEISQLYGLSRERVRQLINQALLEVKDALFRASSNELEGL